MNIEEIKKILPHIYPFLLIDKVIKYKKNEYGIGIKNVTINEPYFHGHFKDNPVVPGVLIVESCAQLFGLICADMENKAIKHQYLASIKDFDFKKTVAPGDTMYIEVKNIKSQQNLVQADIRVKTQKGVIATGILVNTNLK